MSGPAMTEDECYNHSKKTMQRLSRCLGNDEDAHEEDHDEEDPHEKPVHHLGDLLPLCCLDTSSSLLAEAVGNELDVLHHLRKRRIGELQAST